MALGVALVEALVAFVALLLAINYFRKKKDPRYPPGPAGLPVIGNLFQMGRRFQEVLWDWADEYGPIFSIKLMNMNVIVLNDHKLCKEVFQETSASGRTPNPVFLALADGNHGIIMAEGAHWEQQRRFTLRKLRDFGFAKSEMEGLIMEEVNSMTRWLEKRLNTPFYGNRIFNGAVVNSLWNIISGERNEWDAAEKPAILRYADDFMDALHRMNETGLIVAPFLRFIAPKASGWTGWVDSINNISDIGQKTSKRHLQELDPNNPHDFMDHYLIEKENEQDPTSSFYKDLGDKNLRAAIFDLFIAGSETTSHTLSWTLAFLAQNQTVQKKLQKELDSVVGQSRPASLSDKANLPYTEAVMTEVLRRTGLATNGVPHRMTQDAMIQGYFFPKNTTVMSNIFRIHNDPKVWGDPENFRPERFLSPDGTKFEKHDAFMPFSVGKRQCLGMSLANDTIFLFLANLFQKFSVRPDPADSGDAVRNVKPVATILNDPKPFKIIVSLR